MDGNAANRSMYTYIFRSFGTKVHGRKGQVFRDIRVLSFKCNTCISLLNDCRSMLRGYADESLGQWWFGLSLCICILFLLWLRQFGCTKSDDESILHNSKDLLDAMLIARRTLCQFERTAATAEKGTRQYHVHVQPVQSEELSIIDR